HRLGGRTKEVRAPARRDPLIPGEAEIGLVHQGGRGKGIAVPAVIELAVRNGPQLVVDEREDLLERRGIHVPKIAGGRMASRMRATSAGPADMGSLEIRPGWLTGIVCNGLQITDSIPPV